MNFLISGCTSSRQNEPIFKDNYCSPESLYFKFHYSEKNKIDLKKSGHGVKQYVVINETSDVCFCQATIELKKECFDEFEKLNK